MSCLLLVVVRTRDRREIDDGRHEAILVVRSDVLAVDGKVNESVAGSDSPGKDDSRMLTFEEAIFERVRNSSRDRRVRLVSCL